MNSQGDGRKRTATDWRPPRVLVTWDLSFRPVEVRIREDSHEHLGTAGLAPTTLARITGHSDPGFTLKAYARDTRDDAALVADVLERAASAGLGG